MYQPTKVTSAALKRFPALYKLQARQIIEYECRTAISTTADCFIIASLLALIEEFDFGTAENATRLQRFAAKLQSIIDNGADSYDDAVKQGLLNRLHAHGVEYNAHDYRKTI